MLGQLIGGTNEDDEVQMSEGLSCRALGKARFYSPIICKPDRTTAPSSYGTMPNPRRIARSQEGLANVPLTASPIIPSPAQVPDVPRDMGTALAVQPPQSMEARICSYSWSCDLALRVAQCESSLGQNPRAYERGRLHAGLYQLSRRYHEWRFLVRGWTWEDAYDDARNAAVAYEIQQEQGWTPWNASRSCWR